MPLISLKKRNGYLEKGKPKEGGITLFLCGFTDIEAKETLKKLSFLTANLKIKHIVVGSADATYPENEKKGALIAVLRSDKSRICSSSIAFCGKARLELITNLSEELYAKVIEAINSFNSKNLTAECFLSGKTVTVDTNFYDTDELDRFTMLIAIVAAPYFPLVNSVYAYPPPRVNADITRFISLNTGIAEEEYELTTNYIKGIAPLSNLRSVAIIEWGLED